MPSYQGRKLMHVILYGYIAQEKTYLLAISLLPQALEWFFDYLLYTRQYCILIVNA